jgi:hypothetical protein
MPAAANFRRQQAVPEAPPVTATGRAMAGWGMVLSFLL